MTRRSEGGGRTFPAVLQEKPPISLEPVPGYRVGSVHQIQHDIVEKRLKRRNGRALRSQEARKGIGRSETQRQDLPAVRRSFARPSALVPIHAAQVLSPCAAGKKYSNRNGNRPATHPSTSTT